MHAADLWRRLPSGAAILPVDGCFEWKATSSERQPAHDIPSNLQLHVELWDRYNSHVRWVIAAMSSIVIGNEATTSVSVHPQECVLLRQGIRVIWEHVPKNDV